jgi:hypothetical protein
MFQGKRRNIIIGGIIAVVAVALIWMKLGPAQKQTRRPLTSREVAQNECSVEAFKRYLQNQLILDGTNSSEPLSFLSMEKILARRRLQEQFCLEFVRCNPQTPTSGLDARVQAAMLDSCLRDETLEHYDAVPRDSNDN